MCQFTVISPTCRRRWRESHAWIPRYCRFVFWHTSAEFRPAIINAISFAKMIAQCRAGYQPIPNLSLLKRIEKDLQKYSNYGYSQASVWTEVGQETSLGKREKLGFLAKTKFAASRCTLSWWNFHYHKHAILLRLSIPYLSIFVGPLPRKGAKLSVWGSKIASKQVAKTWILPIWLNLEWRLQSFLKI